MASEDIHFDMYAMYRRWAYMLVAIVSSMILLHRPVFNFQEDKGIIYVRSFSMDQKTFYVTQTTLQDGVPEITATMSVKWLYYCNKAMQYGCILCFLCFFSSFWRVQIATFTAIIAGVYYILLIYYAMRISDLHYATLYPNYMTILPAIVCQMMIMTRTNVIRSGIDEAEASLAS